MSFSTDSADTRSGFLFGRLFEFKRQIEKLDSRLTKVFLPWAIRHPRHIPAAIRLVRSNGESRSKRARLLAADGLRVPPFLVLSVTSSCNLRCSGCYAGAVGTVGSTPKKTGLKLDDWRDVVDEAVGLGVIGFVIAGGEPFLLPDLVTLFRDYPDRLFLVFTNGTALRPKDFAVLRRCTNTVVVVSLEGNRALTDLRRGEGVFERALGSLDKLRSAGVLTGIAVTVGAGNIDYWTESANIDELIAHSGPLAFFIEEIPTANCQAGGALTLEQRARFRETIVAYRNRKTGGAYIIHSPDDEEALGGCVSAGRGFAHVNPGGDVTACPVSALATHNLKKATLRSALASPLFSMIRENGHLLETAGHPCGLFAHAEELKEMAAGLGAYPTDQPVAEDEDRRKLVSIR